MVIKIDRKAAAQRIESAEQVPIFELEDDEGKPRVYSIPKVTRSEIALRYLDVANERGDDAANYYLLTTMFGQEAYDALLSVDGLEEDDLAGVIEQVSRIVMPASNPKGRTA